MQKRPAVVKERVSIVVLLRMYVLVSFTYLHVKTLVIIERLYFCQSFGSCIWILNLQQILYTLGYSRGSYGQILLFPLQRKLSVTFHCFERLFKSALAFEFTNGRGFQVAQIQCLLVERQSFELFVLYSTPACKKPHFFLTQFFKADR